MAFNQKNNFSVIGRLAGDVKVFDNKDGSKKLRFTVAAKNNYRSTDGTIGTQMIPVEVFISADRAQKDGIGRYANIHKGDLVGVVGTINNNNYTKDGVEHYELVLRVESLEMLEPKSVTDARLAKNAVENSAEEAPAPEAE